MDFFHFLYSLKAHKIYLWKKEDNNIGFSFDKALGIPEDYKEILRQNKPTILEILSYNQILSLEDAKNTEFFKIPYELLDHKLTGIQKGMFVQSHLDTPKYTYTIPLFIHLKDANPDLAYKALYQFLEENPLFRMQVDEKFSYELVPTQKIEINTEQSTINDINEIYERKSKVEFTHYNDFLVTAEIISITDTNDLIINLTHHHMLSDAYSVNLIKNAFLEIYKNLLLGKSCPRTYQLTYFDYATYQGFCLTHDTLKERIVTLAQKLDSCEPLHLKQKTTAISSHQSSIKSFNIGHEDYSRLCDLAQRNDVSLYAILATAFYHTLSAFAAEQINFPLAITVANRPEEFKSAIGPFINTLPLIPDFNPQNSLIDNIKDINNKVISLNEQNLINLNMLVEASQKGAEEVLHLMRVMFTMHNFKNQDAHSEIAHTLVHVPDTTEKFGLTLTAKEVNNQVYFELNFINELFDVDYVDSIICSYISILSNIKEDFFVQPTNTLPLLDKSSYEKSIITWNQTCRPFFDNKTIHGMFEEQALKTPDNVAVIYNQTRLTYREVDEKANILAQYLKQTYNITPDSLVCLCLDRSEHMLITILGVLKAGGAYAPIDPLYPDDRICYILEDTRTKVLLTNKHYQDRLMSLSQYISHCTVEAVDDPLFIQQTSQFSNNRPDVFVKSTNLAYVIYTSGTTGHPKGVMLEHRGIVNRIQWASNFYPLYPNDKVLQKTPYVFDISVWEFFWATLYGASIIFAKPEGHKDPEYLIDLIKNESISIVHFVPSMLGAFQEALEAYVQENDVEFLLPSVRYVFCSGEELKLSLAKKNHKLLPHAELHNLFGPTEASIEVLYFDCTSHDLDHVDIGRPIDNTSAYILNNALLPLPVGAIGELYIGGVNLARGYLNRPELTAEKFIGNPFKDVRTTLYNHDRLYKTGDLARYQNNGEIEFLGRKDFQVKIRGYRIELGEIEAALSSIDGIKQSIVLVKEHTESNGAVTKYLVGYYVSNAPLGHEVILQTMEQHLPEYMVPSAFVHLSELPLTLNGKLDRKALPDPEFDNSYEIIVPKNDIEISVRDLWAEILHKEVQQLSVREDFFRLGGDSIMSIQLISRLRRQFNVKITVKDIFNCKTIEKISDLIAREQENTTKEALIQSEQGCLMGEAALLPIQEWFFAQNFEKPWHWNQAFTAKVPELDIKRLQKALQQLCMHHDAFRLRYHKGESRYIQFYTDDSTPFTFHSLDVRTLEKEGTDTFTGSLSSTLTKWQSNFNLENGPLACVGYLHGYADGSARLFFSLHHLIVDTVSWSIFLSDLQELYEGHSLGEKSTSYRQWSKAVSDYAQSHQEEKAYWQNVLQDYQHPDYVQNQHDEISTASFSLSPTETETLLGDMHAAYHTQINDALLTSLGLALQKIVGGDTHHILVEGHGREEIADDIDVTRTVGWFTTLYPVRLEVKEDLGASLKHIKESLRAIPHKGLGYGALEGYNRSLPLLTFNYLGKLDREQGDGDWLITNEPSGKAFHPDNHLLNTISVLAHVYNNQFHLAVTSSLGRDFTHSLNEKIRLEIKGLINYASAEKRHYLTASDIGYLVNQEDLDGLQKHKDIESIYLANSLQQGFIYHTLMYGDYDAAYRIQMKWHYEQSLDLKLLKKSWELAQEKYPSLRLRLQWDKDFLQAIDTKGELSWCEIDLSHEHDPKQRAKLIAELEQRDIAQPYQLDLGSLFRIYLIKQTENLYTCVVNMHHAIIDGWSGQLLIHYIHDTYLRLKDNQAIPTERDSTYLLAQQYLQKHENAHLGFWQNYLNDTQDQLDFTGLFLDTCRSRSLDSYRTINQTKVQTLNISQEVIDQLKNIRQREGITFNTIFQYLWHKVLSIYGLNQKTIVGTIFSGRNLPIENIEQSVGLYINTLPLIVDHVKYKDESVLSALQDIQDEVNNLQNHCLVNLGQLQYKGGRLFHTLFIFENYPQHLQDQLNQTLKIRFDEGFEKHDYPITVSVIEKGNNISLKLEYAGELFEDSRIDALLKTYLALLEQVAIDVTVRVSRLTPLTIEQQQKLLIEYSEITGATTPKETISELFEKQVLKTPRHCALMVEEKCLSYDELNARANQLAHLILKKCHHQKQPLIGICLERSEELIISLLAVLKAGAAYAPISPDFPDQRIKLILEDTQAPLVLTQNSLQDRLRNLIAGVEKDGEKTTVLSLDDTETRETLLAESKDNPSVMHRLDNLAYVIYTSGTTGVPNGVMIEHRSFMALLETIKNRYFKEHQLISTFSLTNFVFDIFGLEYALPLTTGGTLTLGDYDFEQLDCVPYTFIQMTPQLLNLKLPQFLNTQQTTLLVGGENLKHSVLAKALEVFPTVVNVYGPTETTIWSTAKQYKADEGLPLFVTIGETLEHEMALVLDQDLNPVPVGAVGELHLGGIGLARGYWNRLELTNKKFIEYPFARKFNECDAGGVRLYKTGDLVRLLDDGEFEYIGRIDFQAKIRGHRIELEEIENSLLKQALIKQASVLIREEKGEQYVVAHIVLNTLETAATEEQLIKQLKNALKNELAEYMIPQHFSILEKMPLNASGKVDRKALEKIPLNRVSTPEQTFIARNAHEKLLHEIWCNILQRNNIGRNESFFDLGGNSLLLIKMLGQLPKLIKDKVKILDVFEHPTLAELSTFLEKKGLFKQAALASNTPSNAFAEQFHNSLKKDDAIAIIGMAGRFPEADDLEEFWDNIISGRECTHFYSKEELLNAGIPSAWVKQSNYIRAQAILKNIKRFDAEFFGYSKKEAEIMDPQHRVFMECAWTALEDSNYNPFDYKGKIGLFGGCGQNDYVLRHVLASQPNIDMAGQYQVMIHNQNNFLCTKTAYKLNLTGPAMTVQTACSTSLVAVHQACLALYAGDCDIALAGAISIGKVRPSGYFYQQGMIFSPDGKCRAFDKNAQGTFEGQGVGIVALKPLARALQDNDHIYAVIKATAINNDGHHKIGYTAPSIDKQAEVIEIAQQKAKISAESITYIEAHGTGTALGDPIEIKALIEAFRKTTSEKSYCAIGSVKTNFGHLDVAAGMAGLIKTILSLYHKKLAPSLHFKESNTALNLSESPFFVNTHAQNWDAHKKPRRAGVSSFGIGGTNAHVVLEEAPKTPSPYVATQDIQLISLSANSSDSLKHQLNHLAEHLKKQPNIPLTSVAYTLHTRRNQFKYNAFCVAKNSESLISDLENEHVFFGETGDQRPLVFMFPGQGAQYTRMGDMLYQKYPFFRGVVDECINLINSFSDTVITYEDLFTSETIHQTKCTQPALFITEYALARLFIEFGIKPDLMIGHSLGEYVAACLAGVFSLRDALKLVITRGQLIQTLKAGKMLAVSASSDEISSSVYALHLDIAAINLEGTCVASGSTEKIDQLQKELSKKGIESKSLQVSHAFHSCMLDSILTEFKNSFGSIILHAPQKPFISNVTGTFASDDVATPEYWVKHLRETVLFAVGVNTILSHPEFEKAFLLEVGPGQVLTNLAKRNLAKQPSHIITPSLSYARDEEIDEQASFLKALGYLWAAGININWSNYYAHTAMKCVKLPTYPFSKTEYWIEEPQEVEDKQIFHTNVNKKIDGVKDGSLMTMEPQVIFFPQTGDPITRLVYETWKKILGAFPSSDDDEFFASGGDSLAAVQFVSQIKNKINLTLDLMVLEKPTVKNIIKKLHRKEKDLSKNTPFITIRQGDVGQSIPLVLVHPIGGDIYFYRDLMSCLPERQTVYGIRSPMLDGGDKPNSIEELAEHYLQILEANNVTDPYVLLGSSFGGILAYEMAQQNHKIHGTLSRVVMIDSPAYTALPKPMSGEDILAYLMRYGLANLNITVEELKALGNIEAQINLIVQKAKELNKEHLFSKEYLPIYLHTWQAHNNIMQKYKPQPYEGDVTFYSHSDAIKEFPTRQDEHWQPLVKGDFSSVSVPGHHISMNAYPNVKVIGESIKIILEKELALSNNKNSYKTKLNY